eukprot:UN08505
MRTNTHLLISIKTTIKTIRLWLLMPSICKVFMFKQTRKSLRRIIKNYMSNNPKPSYFIVLLVEERNTFK